ncbi:alpha-expansin [Klebsormidium nitens]|uniref:Alpha-expansin n=1 Tax=Klebsormidium nitens TaxID=105231 RepID=A0A1Y1I8P1_KLENI|nr:alpha-expansin [Klebsormidium nitens]|eukprot:GAQ85077.1 alpha-expansin [Klebsormidium nitens]
MNRGRLLPALLLLACLSIRARAAGADGAEWKSDAHCTFYTGTTDVSGGYAGNCGYGDLSRPLGDAPPYGPLFFAGSPLLYGGGAGCGSCYEVRCANHDACNGRSVVVTMTDFCPTEGNLPWCAPDRIHFDLSGYAMAQIVKDVAVGTTPLEYRRVDCPREGPAVVGVVGNPYWMEISVRNLARSGAYDAMRVRDAGGAWKDIKRDWGANFVVNEQLRGNISVEISDPATGDRPGRRRSYPQRPHRTRLS